MSIIYKPKYLSPRELDRLLDYLSEFIPIWESRYSASRPPPEGTENRDLLRPVYWLGNWQFACLNYYHPPKGIENRCVKAEDFPELLQSIVDGIENQIRQEVDPRDIPKAWHLNTCLVNYYGNVKRDGKWIDVARVGEHKDFEPGPVASLSFGEKALFQFVASEGKSQQSRLVKQFWLEDNSLQVFAGETFKRKLFHRVQRVEDKLGINLAPQIEDFNTRRINLTFRFVPKEHIKPLDKFPETLQKDVAPYVLKLAQNSEFWKQSQILPG